MQKKLSQLQEKAVNEALAGRWESAIKLNEEIAKLDSHNLDALLRLGFANMQINEFVKSKKAYQKALRLQPANQIAKNNLQKIAILEKKPRSHLSSTKFGQRIDPNLFLNVIGKTKAITLINIGQAGVLVKLKIGQPVLLQIKKRHVEIRTDEGEYVGALPDDISKRLIYFLEAKSLYETYVKEASKNSVDIFIKEFKLGTKVKRFISFPKNIQDNLKTLGSDDESKTDEIEDGEDDRDDSGYTEAPIDIEVLAEEMEESEFYPSNHRDDEDEDEI